MDSGFIFPASEQGILPEIVHEQLPLSGNEGVVPRKINCISNGGTEFEELNIQLETAMRLNDSLTVSSVAEEETVPAEGYGQTNSKELGDKEKTSSKKSKLQNAKNEKPLSSKNSSTLSLKKINNGEGLQTSDCVQKQHSVSKVKSRSFNDGQQLGKSDATLASAAVSESEDLVEKSKLKLLKKTLPNNDDGSTQCSLSPTMGDVKPRKVGTLPSYNFNFKCDERAARRKEFYSKLEEKIHAKEVEKNNLQAKTKETQEAEIKMLRKSLTFKATPMPTFYQEPPPPRVELKKIPTTRARSPKLGRKKSSPTKDAEGNSDKNSQTGRLSLDETLSKAVSKEPSPARTKKPQRKSLPKLPSEKSTLSNEKQVDTSQNPTSTSKTAKAADPQIVLSDEAMKAATHVQEEERVAAADVVQLSTNVIDLETVEDQAQNQKV